jgi:cytoskeletal protein RodZ
MAKSDEILDRVFRDKLENQEASPSQAAWEKLEAQLDAGKQPKRNSWWAIAAAMPLLLGLGYLIWSQVPQADQENFLATTEDVLEIPPVSESTPEAETVVTEEAQYQNSLAETVTPSSSKPALNSILPQENSKVVNLGKVVAEAVTFPSPQAAVAVEVNSVTESKTFLITESTHTTPSTTSSQASLADGEDLDGYRVRIFSDGLKKEEAPNKNLITELGKTVGQVEGLLDKLDEGFVEIQDKKERLFSSLTSRKAPSIEKQ